MAGGVRRQGREKEEEEVVKKKRFFFVARSSQCGTFRELRPLFDDDVNSACAPSLSPSHLSRLSCPFRGAARVPEQDVRS